MKPKLSSRRDFLKTVGQSGISISTYSFIPEFNKKSFQYFTNSVTIHGTVRKNLLQPLLNQALKDKDNQYCHPWAPVKSLSPVCKISGQQDNICFQIESNDNAGCHGGWEIVFSEITPGKAYNFESKAKLFGIPHPVENVSSEIFFFSANDYKPIDWSFVCRN